MLQTNRPARLLDTASDEDQAAGDDDVTVTVEVDVEDDASPGVDVTVEDAEESPAA